MKAIDTNVLVRLIMQDDARQVELARAAFADGVLIPITVLLETSWVLKSFFGFDRRRIAEGLLAIIDSPSARVNDEDDIRRAISHSSQGADLADMLHQIASRGADSLLTFDRKFAKAAREGPAPVELLDP